MGYNHLLSERAPRGVEGLLPFVYLGRLRVLHVDKLARQLIDDGHAGRVRVHLLVEPIIPANRTVYRHQCRI